MILEWWKIVILVGVAIGLMWAASNVKRGKEV
jgi:hypothetical protein